MSRRRRDGSWSFTALECAAGSAGLVAVHCSGWHWQVRGGPIIVNFYPTKGTVYVNGAVEKCRERAWTPEAVVGIAINGPRKQRGDDRRSCRAEKQERWNRGPRVCCWCGTAFATIADATVEHVLPLSRGGSNRVENIRLACQPCNRARGSAIASPSKSPKTGANR